MIWIRRLFQVIFGLLSCAPIFFMLITPNPDYSSNITILILFILIILVLGPWWPSPGNTSKWKLGLPTDNPKVAVYLLPAAFGLVSLCLSWSVYTDPNHKPYRIEKIIAVPFGNSGVAIFWLMVGFSCLWGAYIAYNRSKSA